MTDTPTTPSIVSATPVDGSKLKLPFGLELWQLAAAAGLGAGVLLGLRVGQLLRPARIPVRVCGECEKRAREEREKLLFVAGFTAPQTGEGPDPDPTPTVVGIGQPEEIPTPRPFSAQAIPDAVEVAPGDSSVPDED